MKRKIVIALTSCILAFSTVLPVFAEELDLSAETYDQEFYPEQEAVSVEEIAESDELVSAKDTFLAPGTAKENAAPLALNTGYYYSMPSDTQKNYWYKFTTTDADNTWYIATFKTSDYKGLMYMSIYDETGTRIAKTEAGFPRRGFMPADLEKNSVYYVMLEKGTVSSTGTVHIDISAVYDEYGDTFEAAKEITIADTPLKSNMAYAAAVGTYSDKDYFSFTPTETAKYKAVLYNENSDKSIRITLIDSDKKAITFATVKTQNTTSITRELQAGQKYYYLIGEGEGDYTLTLSNTSAPKDPEPSPTPSPAPTTTFTDVHSGDFYYDAVNWAADKEVTTGKSATIFAPKEKCTRGQVVTFLWRAYGRPEPKISKSPFVDVQDPTAYYYKAVLWAAENEVTTGITPTTFKPESTVTRAQFVTFLYRAENKPKCTNVNPFNDVPEGTWYTDAIKWAYENKITTGLNATTFGPNNACTRGQVVTFIYRLFWPRG